MAGLFDPVAGEGYAGGRRALTRLSQQEMGTSSSYAGPVGTSGLLPPWADEDPSTETAAPEATDPAQLDTTNPPEAEKLGSDPENPISVSIAWSVPKGNLSRIARGTSQRRYDHALSSYVRASGGSRGATRTASAGRASTAALGGFLGAIAGGGVAAAVRALGIATFVGRSAQALLADIVDLLAPAGALMEEAAARKALITTIDDLFREFDVENNGLTALDRMDRAAVERVMLQSVVNYVHERWQQQLVACIERGTVGEADANAMIGEVKEFIAQTVAFDLRGVDVVRVDWRGREGKNLVERIYLAAYGLLESS